jgi:hypothetical protein
MKRPVRDSEDGTYHIKGKQYPELFGSRRQVMNNSAYKTTGNLTRNKLHFNPKTKRYVSKLKHTQTLKNNPLKRLGLLAKPGTFGPNKSKSRKNKRRSAKKTK